MNIEILEITPSELLGMLSAMNYFDVSKLLAETVYMHAEKVSDSPALYKDVANELVAWCEPIIFNSDTVIDSLKDASFHPEPQIEFDPDFYDEYKELEKLKKND